MLPHISRQQYWLYNKDISKSDINAKHSINFAFIFQVASILIHVKSKTQHTIFMFISRHKVEITSSFNARKLTRYDFQRSQISFIPLLTVIGS